MFWLFTAHSAGEESFGDEAGKAFDQDGRAGGYLTNGIDLYRLLGAITLGPSSMVGLENCRSLEVSLIAVDDLRSRRLRPVTPAATASKCS